jgi:FkbM family methyltransferase
MNTILVRSNGKSLGLQIRDEADASVAAEIFTYHEYRSAEDVIKHAKLPILDIGAHAGFFTLYVRSLNPTVKVVAVEPVKENVVAVKHNLKVNSVNGVEVKEMALSEHSGERMLMISKDSHNHALAPEFGVDNGESRIVETMSLSDFLKNCIMEDVSLIKMDIEGAEYEVFRSIPGEDYIKIRAFILEYHNGKEGNVKTLETTLRENGFGVQIFPSKFDKTMGFLFALNKRT